MSADLSSGRSYPLPANEAERLAALREFDFLYDDQREALVRICDLGRELLYARSTSINLMERDRLKSLTRSGHSNGEIPRSDAICAFTLMGADLFEVPDLSQDPRFAGMLRIATEPHLRFYAGVPLVLDGMALGSFCVTDLQPRHLTDDQRQRLTELAALVVDIMRLHRTTQALARREMLLAQSSRLARIGGWEMDPVTDRVTVNNELYRILELEPGVPLDLDRVFAGVRLDDRARLQVARDDLRRHGKPFDLEIEFLTARRSRRWARVMGEPEERNGQVIRLFGAVQDITERKLAEARIHHLAHHDPLTGLPNRALFRQRLHAAIHACEDDGSSFALMLLDFDNFKHVNDVRGHAVGDKLLEASARRLIDLLGSRDTVARLGGDEFAIIVRDMAGPGDVTRIAETIVETLMQPIDLGEEMLVNGVSVGVTLYPDDDRAPSELMKNADIALYLAKSSGRARAAYFTPALRHKFEERLALIEEVRRGIAAGEFVLYFQPICVLPRAGCRQLKGFEALMRWHHPRLGVLTPAFFGAAFEETELARALGEIGLEQVIRQIVDWTERSVPFGYVALNVAQSQVMPGDFFQRVAERVRDSGIRRGALMVEVTEMVYLSTGVERINADLQALHDLGVGIALDDFGTGYAALTHLKQFPVDLMKIDRSFIRQIGTDRDNTEIARAVINLGHALGIDVVAEGVENLEQASFLAVNGCETMQGYFFARAMPAEEVAGFIAELDDGDGNADVAVLA